MNDFALILYFMGAGVTRTVNKLFQDLCNKFIFLGWSWSSHRQNGQLCLVASLTLIETHFWYILWDLGSHLGALCRIWVQKYSPTLWIRYSEKKKIQGQFLQNFIFKTVFELKVKASFIQYTKSKLNRAQSYLGQINTQ